MEAVEIRQVTVGLVKACRKAVLADDEWSTNERPEGFENGENAGYEGHEAARMQSEHKGEMMF